MNHAEQSQVKPTKSLLHKISLIFFFYTVIVLLVTGVSTYISQLNIYRQQCEKDIRNIGQYLTILMENDREDFKTYQEYFDFVDSLDMEKQTVVYGEDGKVTLDFTK